MQTEITSKKARYLRVINICVLALTHCVCIQKIQSSIHVIEQTHMNQTANVEFCELEGKVMDDQRLSLPGATISIKSEKGKSFEVYSDASGNFSFPNLYPGIYLIAANLEGFKKVELRELVLTSGSKIRVEVILRLDGKDVFTVT